MKILAFSDLHAHKFADFSEVDDITGNSRFTNILKCLDYMKNYALENKITHVLFMGDLYHKRKTVETTVFNLTFNKIEELAACGLHITMLRGNHDMENNSHTAQHSLEAFKQIENVKVLDTFEPFDLPETDITVYPAPYCDDKEAIKKAIDSYAYTTVNEGLEDKSILMFHLGITGAFVGKSSYAMQDAFTIGDLMPHAFRFVAGGHYHRYQDLGGYEHAFYAGAPIQGNFNDEGEDKGFVVLDMETGTKEFQPIPNPKFMTIEVDELNDEVLAELEEKTKGNYVRYRVPANQAHELAEKLPEDSKHRLEVQKDYDGEKRIDVDIDDSYEEIIKKYAKEFNPEALAVGLEIFRDSQTK